MTLSRRTFLRSGTTAVLVTGLALDALPSAFARQAHKHDPKQDFQVSFEAKQEAAFSFKRETFQPYLNGVFELSAGANSVEATLVSVRDCTPDPKQKVTKKSRQSDSFALVFRAEGKLTDLTSIYDVEHAALGKFPLFLTRRDGPQGKHFYEAVFNHAL
jgi:hypothetical protein